MRVEIIALVHLITGSLYVDLIETLKEYMSKDTLCFIFQSCDKQEVCAVPVLGWNQEE